MITITESRVLNLYLCDADGQPVRAACDDDLRQAGWVQPDGQVTCSHCLANVAVAYTIRTEQDREIEQLRARLAAWEPVIRAAQVGVPDEVDKAVFAIPAEHLPKKVLP